MKPVMWEADCGCEIKVNDSDNSLEVTTNTNTQHIIISRSEIEDFIHTLQEASKHLED
jgi:hypothetical protein